MCISSLICPSSQCKSVISASIISVWSTHPFKYNIWESINVNLCQQKSSFLFSICLHQSMLWSLLEDYSLFCGEGNGTPLQYSCLENPMDRGAKWAAAHGVAKSRTGLSDFTFTFHFHALEKEMATHSSVLAWRIPGTGEPGGLPSMGSHRVRHDWSDLEAAAAAGAFQVAQW